MESTRIPKVAHLQTANGGEKKAFVSTKTLYLGICLLSCSLYSNPGVSALSLLGQIWHSVFVNTVLLEHSHVMCCLWLLLCIRSRSE